MMRTSLQILLLGAALAAPLPAFADCYDVYGCTDKNYFNVQTLLEPGPTCEFLYVMRNEIYAEHHYCFQTQRGIAAFGNAGCVSSNANLLGLNRFELANAATILQAEQAKGCPEY